MRNGMRKRICLCLLAALLLLPAGCGKKEEEKLQLRLFYPAADYEAGGDVLHSRAIDWSAQEEKDAARQLETVVQLLLPGRADADFPSPLPEGTELLSCSVSGGVATLDFSAAYGRLSGFDLTVANYCITLSAAQIPGVRWIEILVDGAPLPGQTQYLTTGDVLLTSSEDVVKAVQVTLYFPDETGTLQPEKRELLIYEGENHCQRVMEALLDGPTTEGLTALLPASVQMPGVWMEDDVCCLNFTFADYRTLCESTVGQESLVQGLVRSLCSLSGVERVQILVNGGYRTRLGTVDIENPIWP